MMTDSIQDPLFEISPSETSDGERKRTDYDRLLHVRRELGFIPQSKLELNYATLALDNRDVTGGFARFLNEVLLHQKKSVSRDRAAALRSIVGKVSGFAETTRADKTSLQAIDEELDDARGTQNFLELDNVPSLNGWEHQPLTRRGLGVVTRELFVDRALSDHKAVDLDSIADRDGIEEMMSTARVYEATNAIKSASEGLDDRFVFWTNCLEQAQQHTVVRQMAQRALEKLSR